MPTYSAPERYLEGQRAQERVNPAGVRLQGNVDDTDFRTSCGITKITAHTYMTR